MRSVNSQTAPVIESGFPAALHHQLSTRKIKYTGESALDPIRDSLA